MIRRRSTCVLTNPHGVRSVKAVLEQDGKSYPVPGPTGTGASFSFLQECQAWQRDVEVGRANAPALHDGKARLMIEAQSNDFRGETSAVTYDVDVITRPPHVVADGVQHYVNQAGCGLVVFTPSGYVSDSGVQVREYIFRSFRCPTMPASGSACSRIPGTCRRGSSRWCLPPIRRGRERRRRSRCKLFPKKFHESTIVLTDAFMEKVVSDIDPENKVPAICWRASSISIARCGKQNSKTLYDLRLKTEEAILWKGPVRAAIRPRMKPSSRTTAPICTTARRWISRCIWDSIWRTVSTCPIVAPNSGKVV